ncbi:choice-of-anchor D domain-containing protein [Edaphobacter aggregans]|uniref:choice-of-anchor D domain-containing protein n=1 Tax=Edaphobacter aggregans TaxID=570835 RepID=UPI001FDF449A|nr:choice-of-anchor D domain-containing protein [Edaphobacter aggregans]
MRDGELLERVRHGLPNAPVTQLVVGSALPTGDGRAGELRAATYGRGVWQIPLLTAATPAQPAISLSPSVLTFASQAVATASAPQPVTVTNTGSAALTISQIAISQASTPLGPESEFAETDNCVGAPIAVGQSCMVQVTFAPVATGNRSATMTISGNVAGGQGTVALSGTATAAGAVVLTPVVLSFPSTAVNATSAAQNITVSNTGGASLSLGAAAVTGDFRISANTCGATLAANTGCTVAIVFAPTASGTRTGSFTIAAGADTLTAQLNSTAVLPATDTLAPASLSFAAQQLGTSSAAQQVTLTNAGDVALTLISAQIASGDFVAVNSCGNSLAAHASCGISVVFQPKSVGPPPGVLTVADEFRSQSVALSGTGVAPPGVSLSPLFGLSFPATGVGLSSATQTVTLTNNGGLPLAIATVAVSGDFAVVPGSSTCGDRLAISDACTMQIAFRPVVGGSRSGALTIADNANNSPQALSLSGSGWTIRWPPTDRRR